jgi:hypothetical protein
VILFGKDMEDSSRNTLKAMHVFKTENKCFSSKNSKQTLKDYPIEK